MMVDVLLDLTTVKLRMAFSVGSQNAEITCTCAVFCLKDWRDSEVLTVTDDLQHNVFASI